MDMKILAIIVTYNGMQWADRCIGSLLHSTIPLDIIVVDNASSDGSPDWIAAHYPMVHLARFEKNLGFGQANNIGLKRVLHENYDYAFLLNQDAWLSADDCVERLLNASVAHPEYAIVSALWLYGNGERITTGSEEHIIAMQRRGNDLVSDLFFRRPLLPLYETNCIAAAAWLLPRRTIESIGGFDPLFFHRGEDDNYMQRVLFHGGKIGICPSACICHDIEERPDDYDAEHENWAKNMLIDLADVNSPISPVQWRTRYRIQALKQFTYFHWRGARTNWRMAQFISGKIAMVNHSIHINRQKGANWL